MGEAPAPRTRSYVRDAMDEYKQHLRRLAVHDDALLEVVVVEGSSFAPSVLDQRTAA